MLKRLMAPGLLIVATSPFLLTSRSDEGVVLFCKGTVAYIGLEGGFFGIIDDNGEHYDPINLPEELKVDGLKVELIAKIRYDLASYHLWGTIIEILWIKPL